MFNIKEPNHCVSNNLSQTARVISRIYTEEMKPSGINRAQFSILQYIKFLEGIQLSQLADKLFMDRTTLTRNLKPLQRDGLIDISKSKTDARARDLSLTKEGKLVLAEATKLWEKAQLRIVAAYGESQWQTMETSLRDLRAKAAASLI